ncbi:MAG: hypothetical protein ACREFB_16145 [Stellaceae bacterium]
MRTKWIGAIGFLLLLTVPALAQTPPVGTPVRVRGTVEKLDGQVLTIKTREGPVVNIALVPGFKVATLVKAKLSDITDGDYVASTGVKGTDGKLHAVEVRIFPAKLRGAGEGQRPWDLEPGSLMTNATVSGTAKAPDGEVLTVTSKGETSSYIVGPDCPVLTTGTGDSSLLKPGAAVFMIARKAPNGGLTSTRLYAEKDGVKPPM